MKVLKLTYSDLKPFVFTMYSNLKLLKNNNLLQFQQPEEFKYKKNYKTKYLTIIFFNAELIKNLQFQNINLTFNIFNREKESPRRRVRVGDEEATAEREAPSIYNLQLLRSQFPRVFSLSLSHTLTAISPFFHHDFCY